MIITNPLALVLLIAVPFIIYLGWPRMRYRRARDFGSIALRTLIVALLVFGLAGTQIVESSEKLAVVFLVDVSDSITPAMHQAELDYIRDSVGAMGPDDQFGIVLFGANAVIERSISPVRELEAVRSSPTPGNTDMAEAIQLGLGMFPANVARRLVILSDGLPTVGDTEAQVQLAAAAGIEISYVSFTREPMPEVQVTDFRVPTSISEGQQFDMTLTVEASAPTPATITIYASGELIHSEDVNLRQGINNYTLTLASGSAGFKDFLVQVDPASNDSFYQNNRLAAFNTVIGPPRVLVVSDSEDESRYLVQALEEANLNVEVLSPTQIPIGVAALAQYDSVILVNIPATRLSIQRMEDLSRYVEALGGGLVVVGGPEAYAPGGYFDTPLEDTLPVEMQIKDQQRLPQLTIAYVIDRSGSMDELQTGNIPKIELAKEAMIRSIDFLQPTDRAGVISFDTAGSWIAPFQPVYNRLALQQLIGSLRAAGGTDILAGMSLTADAIVEEPSERKHIILLTDGGASPRGLVDLATQLYDDYNTTTSVIAIGDGAAPFLEDMAQAGHGNYHHVIDASSIPTIFAVETVLATRSYIVEESFTPILTANNPIMLGINAAPTLEGYVATTPKLAAQVVLSGPEPFSDPVLAAWQFGLGRAVAFTSDATARWGTNWVQWADFSRFWAQTVQWTITQGASNTLQARVEMENEQARLIVDARDANGAFLNALNLQASLIDPVSQDSQRITLQQVAPGHYEALFTPTSEGAYFMRISGSGVTPEGQPIEVSQNAGWVMSYSPEYRPLLDNTAEDGQRLLENIAELTGGRELNDAPGDVFAHNLRAHNAAAPIWPWLLAVAMLLLPLDVAVRRLIVTRSDLQRLRSFFARSEPVLEGASERVSTLMDARERARRRVEQTDTPSTISALKRWRTSTDDDAEREPLPQSDKPQYHRPNPITAPEEHMHENDEPNIGARLLQKRKRDQEDQ